MCRIYSLSLSLSLGALALITSADLVLASSVVSADDVVDEINITVPVSCSLSGTGMNTHNAEINNGQYNSAIGETTIRALCNDNNGFAIYAIGYTDDTDGKNVLTSSTLGSTYDIITGTDTSGATSNWAMKLSVVSSPTPAYPITIQNSFDSFHNVPDDYTLVAKRTSGTDIGTGAEGSTLKTTYQAYISSTQPAGTYTGQVKYTMIHPHNATAPQKPLEAPSDSCATPVPNYTYMQDINSTNISTVLNSLDEDEPYFLRDRRDNQPYCVAKLKDGKLWMTENLNIAGGTALSSEDTDFDSGYTLPTTSGWTVTNDKLVLPASATKNPDNNNLTDNTQFGTNNYAYVFNSGNKTNCGASDQNTPCYSYYSWDAATLGSGRTLIADNTDATYSICPKNWKLPTSRTTSATNWQTESDFYALAHQYGLDSTTSTSENDDDFYTQAGPGTAPDFLLAGYYDRQLFNFGGSCGFYWSATSSSSSAYARYLYFDSDYEVGSDPYDYRMVGRSVRCLLKTN